MTTFTFTPTQDAKKLTVPYFEDARADFAPFYTSYSNGNRADKMKPKIGTELTKLGAILLSFQDGTFQTGKVRRYGYVIRFSYGGGMGMIRVAGLPLRSETPKKIEAVKVQALMNVREWLKVAVTNQIFSPGADTLIPFMLVDRTPGSERTVADYIAEQGHLPRLNPPPNGDVIEGEWS